MPATLDARIPEGPLEDKWHNWLDDHRLVGPRQRGDHTVIVVGTGLAGASAAATLAGQGYRNVHVRAGNGYLGWPEKAPFDAISRCCPPFFKFALHSRGPLSVQLLKLGVFRPARHEADRLPPAHGEHSQEIAEQHRLIGDQGC